MMTIPDLYALERDATKASDLHRARYLLRIRAAIGDGPLDEQLVRLMAWTAGSLPVGKFHSLLESPVEILISGEAWCDQHVRVFLWGAKELLGLPGRLVMMQHTDGKNGHTVCEVLYDSCWHLFDPHPFHVACYRAEPGGAILSFEELMARPDHVARQPHWWYGEDGCGKEGFFVHPAQYSTDWHERPLALIR